MAVLIGSTFALAIAATGSLAYRLGAFKEVQVERRFDALICRLKRPHGAYHKIAAVISEVETWAKANGEPCPLSLVNTTTVLRLSTKTAFAAAEAASLQTTM